MRTILDRLKQYYENNSQEQIEKDWAESEEYDQIGPLVDEFIKQTKIFYEFHMRDSYWEFSNSNNILHNPKFTSDYFVFI